MARSLIRGLFVIALGLFFLFWPADAVTIVLKVLGASLILGGVVNIVYALAINGLENLKGIGMITLIGSVLFIVAGWVLLAKTDFFKDFIGFIFGLILALYGALTLLFTYNHSKGIASRFWFYLIPALLVVFGVTLCLLPRESIRLVTIVFGAALIVMGLSEIVFSIKVIALNRRLKRQAAEAEQYEREKENSIIVEPIETEEESREYAEQREAEAAKAEADAQQGDENVPMQDDGMHE
ncbi:MAG: DUF308 domain-containing protein [Bacteroidales bacterium]|nr:DUF308 domain-containing protein [Bacteroidales bacterium]